MAHVCDEEIVVDRVALRDGSKAASIAEIFRLVSDVRRRKFDFVIDLHSLYETNLLGYLSGAGYRLFANRENRSFDRLANFPVKPPREDKRLHHADRYFQVLKPLGIARTAEQFRLVPSAGEQEKAAEVLSDLRLTGEHRVGLFLGAGHKTRLWGLENFAALAERLSQRGDTDVVVFLGPEETDVRLAAEEKLSPYATVLGPLPLPTFVAVLAKVDTFVSADTGPMHLAAVAGAAVVLIAVEHTPDYFLPLTDDLHLIKAPAVAAVPVDDVYAAVVESLKK
jgi:ADP-heptose:LPS heptosyltransferase